jgi:hypothetical protein
MSKLEQSVILAVLALALLAVIDFTLYRDSSRVSTTLRTVRDVAVEQYDRLSGQVTRPAAPATTPVAAAAPPRRPNPTPVRSDAPGTAAVTSSSPVAVPPPEPALVSSATPVATTTSVATVRGDYYLAGRASTWTTYNVTIASPTVIRAGGRITAGTDVAEPDGLATSTFERRLAEQRSVPGADQRVLPSAAYLAMVGRVCSVQACSEPFLIGSQTVLCPSDLKTTGNLQVWTNNYFRVDGTPTTATFTNVSGGYSFYVEPAAPGSCAGTPRAAGPASSIDASAIAAGQTLRNPEFVITSSQSAWKPFFLPLDGPLLIRASGSIQPRGGVEGTDPRGIAVPTGTRWVYPGTGDLVVDADHRLYEPTLPYQALIGRLCGRSGCGNTFLVGTERAICPTPQLGDRIEIWINHILRPASLLGQLTPLSLDALDLQLRRGAYRFEVSRAPAGACAG